MVQLMRGSSLSAGFISFILGGMTTPPQADEGPDFVTQTLASHSYEIPRDLIEMIYKPDYSGVANRNPNWSHDPVVRLALQWPEFTAPTISDPQGYGSKCEELRLSKSGPFWREERTSIRRDPTSRWTRG